LVDGPRGGPQSVLARRALIARLDIEKARDGLRDARNAGLVVDQGEAGGAEARADHLERAEVGARLEFLGADDAGGDAVERGLERARAAGTAAQPVEK